MIIIEIDACFACPSCAERIRIVAEYNEEDSEWMFDIQAVEEEE